MNQQECTFLISSCDRYSDAWDPFFTLLHIFGDKQGKWKYPIVLNTEKKKYSSPFFNIRIINTLDNIPWGGRLFRVVKEIKTEYVFLLLEDFFLQEDFNHMMFERILEEMDSDKKIGCVVTTRTGWNCFEKTDRMIFEKKLKKFNIPITAVLYRKDFLLRIIRKHETPWEFEYYAGIRGRRTKYKVMQYNEDFPVVYMYHIVPSEGYGIYKGKWLKKNPALFEKYGIKVDFENLGFYEGAELVKTSSPMEEKKFSLLASLKTPLKDRIRQIKSLL